MRDILKPLGIVVLVLLVPIVPFLILGEAFETRAWDWFTTKVSPAETAAAVILLLSSDMLLPIPSSLVSTLAGARLGFWGGMAASWLGMTIGSLIGFGLARWFGQPILERWAAEKDLTKLQRLCERHGARMLAITRPLPILAEATVLLLGTSTLTWQRFLPTLLLSNLGIAAVYAALGLFSLEQGQLPLALTASVLLPLLVTVVARYLLPQSNPKSPQAN